MSIATRYGGLWFTPHRLEEVPKEFSILVRLAPVKEVNIVRFAGLEHVRRLHEIVVVVRMLFPIQFRQAVRSIVGQDYQACVWWNLLYRLAHGLSCH